MRRRLLLIQPPHQFCLALYEGLAHRCAASGAACLHTSSSAREAAAAPAAASKQAAEAGGWRSRPTKRPQRRYPDEVLQYFEQVKAWNHKMNVLKTQWRTEQLQQHWASERHMRAAELLARKTDVQGGTHSKQAETVLREELERAETELELAKIKLQRAEKFEAGRRQVERQQHARYTALLEASRTWIRRDELVARINAALDQPHPFGFVNTLPDAKKAI